MCKMIYPIIIVKDRYQGCYSGGKWVAWNLESTPKCSQGNDIDCRFFWNRYKGDPKKYPRPVGRGNSPQEAYQDLLGVIHERETKN